MAQLLEASLAGYHARSTARRVSVAQEPRGWADPQVKIKVVRHASDCVERGGGVPKQLIVPRRYP